MTRLWRRGVTADVRQSSCCEGETQLVLSACRNPSGALCIERRRRARDGRVANERAPRAFVTRGASPKTFSRGAIAKGGRARRPRAIDRCYLESRETERESHDTGKIFPVDGRARATRPTKTAETREFVFPAVFTVRFSRGALAEADRVRLISQLRSDPSPSRTTGREKKARPPSSTRSSNAAAVATRARVPFKVRTFSTSSRATSSHVSRRTRPAMHERSRLPFRLAPAMACVSRERFLLARYRSRIPPRVRASAKRATRRDATRHPAHRR